MAKDTKIMFAALILTFAGIVGFAAMQKNKPVGNATPAVLADMTDISVSPENYEMGEVPLDGGIVTTEYQIKNESDEVVKLKKIATSCMCTEASFAIDGKETKYFGMEHAGDKNPPLSIEMAPGETAQVKVNFDPAAHGPQGVGPFNRIVWLTFSDPAGVKELRFDGNVVKS